MQNSSGIVVVLNGTSSAGKSSIINELYKKLGNNFERVQIDDFLWPQLINKAQALGYILKSTNGKDAEQVIMNELPQEQRNALFKFFDDEGWFSGKQALSKAVRQYAISGKNVIIDTVISDKFGNPEAQDFAQQMDGIKAIYVLVYCSLDKLYEFVEARNASGDAGEKRSFAQSVSQFPYMYQLAKESDQHPVDFISKSTFNKVLELVEKEFMNTPSNGRESLSSIKDILTQKFELDTDKDPVPVTGMLDYNLIVNTGKYSPEECADQIVDYMRTIDKLN